MFILILIGCRSLYDTRETLERDKTILYISGKPETGDNWEIECIPEGFVELLDEKYKSIFTSARRYWEFKAIKPGEFTLAYLSYYDIGDWIIAEDCYLEDYTVDENLEIHFKGKRPIYENEKYDRMLFEQFTDEDTYLHIDWELDDYPDITYSLESNYDTRKVDITVYGSNPKNESDLRKIIEDHLNNRFQGLDEVMHDTKINITFEQSDIISDSYSDNTSSED
jgi:hypothetical protein